MGILGRAKGVSKANQAKFKYRRRRAKELSEFLYGVLLDKLQIVGKLSRKTQTDSPTKLLVAYSGICGVGDEAEERVRFNCQFNADIPKDTLLVRFACQHREVCSFIRDCLETEWKGRVKNYMSGSYVEVTWRISKF